MSDITDLVSREGVIVSPAPTGTIQPHTPPVSTLTAVLRQGVEILVVVHPTHHTSALFNGGKGGGLGEILGISKKLTLNITC